MRRRALQRSASGSGLLTALLAFGTLAFAADDLNIQRLATCQDSWLDLKSDPARLEPFMRTFQSKFVQSPGKPFFVPKDRTTVAGLPVVRAFPESLGMGVGFSLVVDAPFDKAKTAVEKAIGKSLTDCERGENMRNCGLQIAEKKTIMLMSEDSAKAKESLLGCYYYYEK